MEDRLAASRWEMSEEIAELREEVAERMRAVDERRGMVEERCERVVVQELRHELRELKERMDWMGACRVASTPLVAWPKLAEFPTWSRCLTAIRQLSQGVPESQVRCHLLSQFAGVCPELFAPDAARKFPTAESLFSYLATHPGEVERAKLTLGFLRAGKKDALEPVYGKIVALTEQAYPDWSQEEQFREGGGPTRLESGANSPGDEGGEWR